MGVYTEWVSVEFENCLILQEKHFCGRFLKGNETEIAKSQDLEFYTGPKQLELQLEEFLFQTSITKCDKINWRSEGSEDTLQ